ncbi:bifunctional folylpolyglutamate synthase/dihydrofolate synthase [Haploplasma modicum]|uniref:bifunctional folylpolyglutamate synthase/dihydrofolate synthase n=1 Tax=Haploplasma modicum TaxID=2150 RepID=UPI00214C2F6E|nr:Mur ligase family protein [Haploplasma modicum]MCR1808991.1 Mur ligase family protein [Haploplasma modicum]
MFNNILDAINWVEHQPRFKEKVSLDDLKKAYDLLNLDFSNVKKIHIGGTNGKGSTQAFITSTLVDSKISVGSFTSPYLVVFNERIRINNENISDLELLNLINFLYDFNEKLVDFKLSFFEIVTLMAFKHFYDKKVSTIIMEIGIGGRLDATNIINYDATVITSVGLDHMKQLGSTIDLIANEKIRALKKNGNLYAFVLGEVKDIFISYAKSMNANYFILDKTMINEISSSKFIYNNLEFNLSLLGSFQQTNAILAFEVLRKLYPNIKTNDILDSFSKTKWAGRLEEISKNIYIDGAHNEPAINALMISVNSLFKNYKVTILYSALKDKDINKMLEIIKKYNYKIILTSFPDFRFMSLEPFSSKDILYVEDGFKVYQNLKENIKEDEVVIITGSLHFIGYIKQMLLKSK